MTAEPHESPATPLERAVHEFLNGAYQEITLGRWNAELTYAIVPVTEIETLRREIDPQRPAPRPFVSFDPAMKGGQATVNGTRLTVEALVDCVWGGWTEEQIRRDGWPDLTRADILTVCWFQGEHGGRTWRKRWRAWSEQAHAYLYRNTAAAVDACPWPPTERSNLGGGS